MSCFACKLKNGKSYGKCAVKDDLAPFLEKIENIDAILFGSPIYFGSISGEMRSFMERIMFQYLEYKGGYPSLYKRKIKTGFIYNMNISNDTMHEYQYRQELSRIEAHSRRTFDSSEALYVNTQFGDVRGVIEIDGFDNISSIYRLSEDHRYKTDDKFIVGFGLEETTTNFLLKIRFKAS
ncbi:NAD(P)H-dependent oxidoreductase [Labilibaculum manganireducens]|uniref:flavodoxin family protein n=1 Tax=Labilibaculum manganireducens TaxID=1940525 RepID=UPI002D1E49D2|nr:NAD(P)H-dependent oxidoreductase [Labilibaculum manganireducens]